VRRVLAKPAVTIQSIYGAISAYMIIGLMFAAFYGAIWHLGGGSFFAGQQSAQHQTNVPTIQYFSFTTLTTLGYGDFTAASDGGRAVAVVEALIGQVFLATLVARLVAAFRGPVGPAQTPQPAPPARPGGGYRRRPPSAVRRGAGMSYRRRPARNASRTSPAAPVAPAPAPERPG
jgi:Ion channel